MQSWLLLNPRGTQYIDSQLVVEYLKLTYDPYVGSANQNQACIVADFLRAVKEMNREGNDDGEIREEKQEESVEDEEESVQKDG